MSVSKIIFLVLLGIATIVQAVDVVRNGKPVSTIVIPDQPLPVVRYAAEELQYHIRRSTGAMVSIMVEKQCPTGKNGCIYLGFCRHTRQVGINDQWVAPNAFIMKSIGKDLFIAGRDSDGPPLRDDVKAGTLFGVYELLETSMGVRWLWPGSLGEIIPADRNLRIRDVDKTVTPRLVHTRFRTGGFYGGTTQGWSSQAVKDKFLNDQAVWLRRHRFARGISLEYGHGFIDYWDRFLKSHPEYFNLLPDGRRVSDPTYFGGDKTLISMCVSEPGLWKHIVEDWKKSRTPEVPWINCAENDTYGKCVCPHCLAWDVPLPAQKSVFCNREETARRAFLKSDPTWCEQLGSLSDRYARFWLSVQKLARKTNPEAVVVGYAYANYYKPPVATKLNDHIVVAIVPAMMFPWTDAKRQEFRFQWDGWAKTGVRLYLRPNYTLDGHNLPIYFADKLGEDFSFAWQRGMIATDFDSLTGQWATQGPNLYVLARMQLHGDWPVSRVLDEYYNGFGKAAPAVRNYFTYWKEISDHVTDDTLREVIQKDPGGGSWATFYRVAGAIFTPSVMDRGFELLKQARDLVQGDQIALSRVEFLEKGLRNAQLTLLTQEAYLTYKRTGQIQSYRSAVEHLDTFRKSVEADDIANMGYLAGLESSAWDRSLLQLLKMPGNPLKSSWKFMWDPQNEGLHKNWQNDKVDTTAWYDIGVDSAYGNQPIGRQWAKDHGGDYLGVVWYRTTFSPKSNDAGKQVRLIFGAVDEACKIWVNGKLLLDRPYPFQGNPNSWQEAFEVDVTKALKYDQPNSLVVRVENHSGAGGIWRPVYLVLSERSVSDSKNLISDPGFENHSPAWRNNVLKGAMDFALVSDLVHTGKTSARIVCKKTDAPVLGSPYTAWGRWYQSDIPVQAGKRYRLRLWVKTSNDFTGTVNIWLRPGTDELKCISTEGLWKELVLDNYQPPENKGTLYLNLVNGTGTVWLDDVELTETN